MISKISSRLHHSSSLATPKTAARGWLSSPLLRFALHALHSTLHNPHSALDTPHSALYSIRCALHIVHSLS